MLTYVKCFLAFMGQQHSSDNITYLILATHPEFTVIKVGSKVLNPFHVS